MPENEATEKAATNTNSKVSALREDAPRIRTADDLFRKYEQVLDAAERGALSETQLRGINQTLKQMKELGIDVPLRVMGIIAKAQADGASVPRARGPLLRSLLGLPEDSSPDVLTVPAPGRQK